MANRLLVVLLVVVLLVRALLIGVVLVVSEVGVIGILSCDSISIISPIIWPAVTREPTGTRHTTTPWIGDYIYITE